MKIAIQGHPTRGKEVIQILESLGGKNIENLEGVYKTFYYINDKNEIGDDHKRNFPPTYKFYTLEEFEKEFPFKVGDLCVYSSDILNEEIIVKILGMITTDNCIMYEVGHKDIITAHSYIYRERNTLKPYKEMKEERNITLTLDKAKEWYKKGGELKEIALQAFTDKELNPLPRSWEEFCKNNPIQDHEAFINYANGYITMCKECAGSGLGIWTRKPEKDRCKCVSQKSAEAHLAMIQLEQLRNCWWGGWKPEWSNCEKYVIKWDKNDLMVFTARNIHAFLVFPTREIAEEFLKCFKDLIEKAGDLI